MEINMILRLYNKFIRAVTNNKVFILKLLKMYIDYRFKDFNLIVKIYILYKLIKSFFA